MTSHEFYLVQNLRFQIEHSRTKDEDDSDDQYTIYDLLHLRLFRNIDGRFILKT